MKAVLDEIHKIKSTTKELREFGFVVGGVLLVIAAIRAWHHGVWLWPLVAVGVALIALGLVWPQVLKPLQKIWMGIAVVLGAVMSRVILTLLFFLIVTPLGLFLKMRGKKLLQRGSTAGVASYWNVRGPESADPKRCERQF